MSLIPSHERPDGDPLRPIQRFCEVVTYCATLGIYAYGVDGPKVCLALPYCEDILGDADRQWINTGAITTLIDSACGSAILHALPQYEAIATLDLRVDYLRPAPAGGEMRCWAWCHRITSNVAFAQSEVYVEGIDEPVATSSASFMRLKPQKREAG
mgnify:CR=1 FL=1